MLHYFLYYVLSYYKLFNINQEYNHCAAFNAFLFSNDFPNNVF